VGACQGVRIFFPTNEFMDISSEQWKVPNLVNKEQFNRLLEMELKRSLRYQSFTSLLLVGAILNGERALGGESLSSFMDKMARLLRKELRETDIVGAVEKGIAVILIQSDKHIAGIVGRRLLTWISDYYGSNNTGKGFNIKIGGACFPSHATDFKGLFQIAEEMLERSKQRDGNLVSVLE